MLTVKNSLDFAWKKHGLSVPESFILVDAADGVGKAPQLGERNHQTIVYVKNCSPDDRRRLQFNFRDCRLKFVDQWPPALEQRFSELENLWADAWKEFVASGEHDRQMRAADDYFMQSRAAAHATWGDYGSSPTDGMRRH